MKKSAQPSINQKPLCFNLILRKQLTITIKQIPAVSTNQEPPVAEPGAKRTGRENQHRFSWDGEVDGFARRIVVVVVVVVDVVVVVVFVVVVDVVVSKQKSGL